MLLVTGLQMASQYHSALASCAASHSCGDLANTLFLGNHAVGFLVILTVGVPGLLGLFWGGRWWPANSKPAPASSPGCRASPAGAGSPSRSAGLLLAAAAWGGAVSALVTWWSSPATRCNRIFQPGQFDIQGIVPVGYALFAVALGIAAGPCYAAPCPRWPSPSASSLLCAW